MVETLVLAFSATALPLLQDTSQDAASVEEMKEAKLNDQATIIHLQKKLIDVKEDQVKKLQETIVSEVKFIHSEMKTFSSVLQKEIKAQSKDVQRIVSSANSFKKDGDAVKQVVDKEEQGAMLSFTESSKNLLSRWRHELVTSCSTLV